MIFKNLLLVCVVFVIIWGCQSKEQANTNSAINTTDFPDQEGWKSKLTATKNGQIIAIIDYGHMTRYNKKKAVYFDEGVIVDFYNEKGQHTSKLTSDKGKLDENTNNVEAYDNVVVVSDSGITLKTEKLWWDNAIEKVITDQFVTITTAEKDTLYGVGFESEQTLSHWIIKEVRGKTEKKLDIKFDKSKSSSHDSTMKKEITE